MKNLFHFLFDESQREALDDSLLEDIAGVWEDMAKAEDIETKKKGLADVLTELGVEFEKSAKADGTAFEEDASSMLFITPDAQLYRRAREIVQRPENMHTLVKAGWVGVPVGQDNTKDDGDARYVLRFLDVSDAEVKPQSSNDTVDMEKLIKKAREYGDGKQDTEKVHALTQPMQAKAKDEGLRRAADELLPGPLLIEADDIRHLSRAASLKRSRGEDATGEDKRLDMLMQQAVAGGLSSDEATRAEEEGRMSAIREPKTPVGEARRCWKGYEATPGKKPFAKGSCRKKK